MPIRPCFASPTLPERASDVRRTLAAGLACAICACGALAASALGRAGDLDHAFGQAGVVTVAPPPYAIADVSAPLLWRDTITVHLDRTFGVNGVARLAPFPETACAEARGLAIRRGGDIYISGTLGTEAAPAGDYLAAIHD